jgi:transposase
MGSVMVRYVGIDVAKDHLDVAVQKVETSEGGEEPTSGWSESFRVENTSDGRAQLVRRLQQAGPARNVLEASGGLERPVVAALGAADLPVVAVKRLIRSRPTSLRRRWVGSKRPIRSTRRC